MAASRLSRLGLQVACRLFEYLVTHENAENGKAARADAMVSLLEVVTARLEVRLQVDGSRSYHSFRSALFFDKTGHDLRRSNVTDIYWSAWGLFFVRLEQHMSEIVPPRSGRHPGVVYFLRECT